LILGKIIKIVAIGCQILSLKRTKSDFGGSSAPDPAGGAYIAPLDPLVGFKGVSSKCGTHDFDPPVKKKIVTAHLLLSYHIISVLKTQA